MTLEQAGAALQSWLRKPVNCIAIVRFRDTTAEVVERIAACWS
ncbi:hypothetical protein AB3662_26320 [Sorangium cellulosum]